MTVKEIESIIKDNNRIYPYVPNIYFIDKNPNHKISSISVSIDMLKLLKDRKDLLNRAILIFECKMIEKLRKYDKISIVTDLVCYEDNNLDDDRWGWVGSIEIDEDESSYADTSK